MMNERRGKERRKGLEPICSYRSSLPSCLDLVFCPPGLWLAAVATPPGSTEIPQELLRPELPKVKAQNQRVKKKVCTDELPI
ncbi:hypothetical protein BJY01DRAFT_27505 [Aspergillus pseudoustus]|uniref:Uncharacterized protein n=1 Tax=Aspergillus pseudoustus TaxID=1810923 RepID=A0ABR4JIM1_9EURO